jgi:hypothetical protein
MQRRLDGGFSGCCGGGHHTKPRYWARNHWRFILFTFNRLLNSFWLHLKAILNCLPLFFYAAVIGLLREISLPINDYRRFFLARRWILIRLLPVIEFGEVWNATAFALLVRCLLSDERRRPAVGLTRTPAELFYHLLAFGRSDHQCIREGF